MKSLRRNARENILMSAPIPSQIEGLSDTLEYLLAVAKSVTGQDPVGCEKFDKLQELIYVAKNKERPKPVVPNVDGESLMSDIKAMQDNIANLQNEVNDIRGFLNF